MSDEFLSRKNTQLQHIPTFKIETNKKNLVHVVLPLSLSRITSSVEEKGIPSSSFSPPSGKLYLTEKGNSMRRKKDAAAVGTEGMEEEEERKKEG